MILYFHYNDIKVHIHTIYKYISTISIISRRLNLVKKVIWNLLDIKMYSKCTLPQFDEKGENYHHLFKKSPKCRVCRCMLEVQRKSIRNGWCCMIGRNECLEFQMLASEL